jgi:hypothetical protein
MKLKTLQRKSLPQREPLGRRQDILNWCITGYAKFCFSRIREACMDAERYSAQAPVGARLERPPPSGDRWLGPVDPNRGLPSRSHAPVVTGLDRLPPSGDRWLRPVDPNRLLPSRCKATVEAGLDASKPGRLYRCQASVAARCVIRPRSSPCRSV